MILLNNPVFSYFVFPGVPLVDSTAIISASAVSHIGISKSVNENNFYLNGRFMYDYETSSVQVSVENSCREHVFAVSDGMDMELQEKGTTVSIQRELKKFNDKIKTSAKGIEVKIDRFCDAVGEVRNLIHSAMLGEGHKISREPSLAGLLITENKAVVLNVGSTRVYMVRNGNATQFPPDHRKAERLLKMGIITGEQAEMLSKRYGMSQDQDPNEIRKSEIWDLHRGDVFLLCSNGLTEAVDEERIYEILLESVDTGQIANMLVREALENGAKENVTVLVVRVDKPENESEVKPVGLHAPERRRNLTYTKQEVKLLRKSSLKRAMKIRRIISTVLAVIIVAGSIYGLYKLFKGFGSGSRVDDDTPMPSTTETTTQDDTTLPDEEPEETPDIDEEENKPAPEPEKETVDWSQTVTYTVKAGDNLYNISRKFYNDPEKYRLIMEANGIENPNLIRIGQVLIIPDPTQSRP